MSVGRRTEQLGDHQHRQRLGVVGQHVEAAGVGLRRAARGPSTPTRGRIRSMWPRAKAADTLRRSRPWLGGSFSIIWLRCSRLNGSKRSDRLLVLPEPAEASVAQHRAAGLVCDHDPHAAAARASRSGRAARCSRIAGYGIGDEVRIVEVEACRAAGRSSLVEVIDVERVGQHLGHVLDA